MRRNTRRLLAAALLATLAACDRPVDGVETTIGDNASAEEVLEAYANATGGSSNPSVTWAFPALGLPGVWLVSDAAQPDAGDPTRHGGFIGGRWVAEPELQRTLFQHLGWADADADERAAIIRRWATGIVGSPDPAEIEEAADGTVRARVHHVGNFNVGGEPMTDEWVVYTFGADGTASRGE